MRDYDIKLSIIVPVYKTERYIYECIDSIRCQTLQSIEIILVDDGSPDRCPQICDEYANLDSRIKVIHKANAGLGFARNSGLELAEGEFVTFVDSDDWVDSRTYSHIVGMAETDNLDVIFFKYDRFTSNETLRGTVSDHTQIYENEELRTVKMDMIASEPGCHIDRKYECSACTAIYRKEIIDINNLAFHSEREVLSEDMIFNLDFTSASKRLGINDSILYHYRINPASLTRTTSMEKVAKTIDFCHYIKTNLQLWNLSGADVETRFSRLFIGHMRAALCHILSSGIECREKRRTFQLISELPEWKILQTNYPWHSLPVFQRECFRACSTRQFPYMLALCYMKKIIKKV